VRAKNVGKKIVFKNCEKTFFYIHANIVTKKWGQKNARNNFSRNTRIVRKKMLGKNRLKKMRKNVFFIHTNIVTKKWGQKNARNKFSRNTRIVRAKNVWKKIVCKKCE